MAATGEWTHARPEGVVEERQGSSPPLRNALQTLALAQVLALAISIEYLFQPFVWRTMPLQDVLFTWLFVIFDLAWVAFVIALPAWVAARISWRLPLLSRILCFAAVVMIAAFIAEYSLRWVDPDGAVQWPALGLHVLRWSAVAMAVVGLLLTWQHALAADDALRHAQQRQLAASTELADLRRQALQSQIEPHFLFNTLATARRLGGTDPQQCLRLLTHLHDFVRLTCSAAPGTLRWRLRDEMDVVRAYLGVIELRMGGRLRLHYNVSEEAGNCETPPLTLATLVENAVKHGIAPATHGGDIAITAQCESTPDHGNRLLLRVADTGVGFGAAAGGGSGIGLANTRARLQNRYGASAELELSGNQPCGVVATIRMPMLQT